MDGGETLEQNWLQRLNTRIGSSGPGSWLAARVMHRLDPLLSRLSGGRMTLSGLLVGLPPLTVTTTGARSGEPRSVPLLGVPDGDRYIVIASNWGQQRHPAWYYNLRANPICTVTHNGETGRYVARQVTGAERERLWQRAVTVYPGYKAYKRRARDREIGVFVLEPAPRGEDNG